MFNDLRATYRVQFHAGFDFADAIAIADYLAALGISHLFAAGQSLTTWSPLRAQIAPSRSCPGLVLKLGSSWGDSVVELPPGRWRHAFTDEILGGGELRVANLLKRFPVALLFREDGS